MCVCRFLCSFRTTAQAYIQTLSEYIVLQSTVAANGEKWLCEKGGGKERSGESESGWGGNFNSAGCTWQQVGSPQRLQLRVKVSARASAAAHV